jgi:hypothetical protein
MIVVGLNRKLPERSIAEPQVHLGSSVAIDVAIYEEDAADSLTASERGNGGGVATAVWSPPRPTLTVAMSGPRMPQISPRCPLASAQPPARQQYVTTL